jgi:hypothetical protein
MSLTPLLPVRHKQGDFFIADIFDNLPFKDDMASMEHPLFTLNLKPDKRILRYENGSASVEMQPSAFGLPNIMDKDILLYCASVIMEKINNGEYPPQTLRLSLNDLLIATNRHTNDRGYKFIKQALNRLTGCMLKTTIKTGRTRQESGFHLIESYRYLESTRVKDRIIGVEITLSDWFYNSLVAKEVLTITREYFRLRSPLDRRLYEIARKHDQHMKEGGGWSISIDKLQQKTGSASTSRHFKQVVKKLMDTDHIPDYQLLVDSNNVVYFSKKRQVDAIEEEGEKIIDNPIFLDAELTNALSEKNIEKAKKAAGRADIYGLWADFREWNMSQQNDIECLEAAFIGWCKKKRQ